MPIAPKLLDCTLRDGGYYNLWDYSYELIEDYLIAMDALNIDYVEIGFRTIKNEGFRGGCAYTKDSYLNSLSIPKGLQHKIGVMINGSELTDPETQGEVLSKLFKLKKDSPVSLVRIACHLHEVLDCLPASTWLKKKGYMVGINLMQISNYNLDDIHELILTMNEYPIDVLYFADSMGSLNPKDVSYIIQKLQRGWKGELGIHTHDNMGLAVTNSMQAIKDGVSWVDSTVTGMGRGPGNAQTEFIIIASHDYKKPNGNPTKLFELIRKYFKPMQDHFGWGANPYYYLAGKYGIHPSYIQEMLNDSRYSDDDIIAVIDHLRIEGGKKFSMGTLDAARHFYSGEARGSWNPEKYLIGREVLIVGAGPSVNKYKKAIEQYIAEKKPYVIALNTESSLNEDLINVRAACHPVRLLADCREHLELQQPLITPFSMLPDDVQKELKEKEVLDYGLLVRSQCLEYHTNYCVLPSSLVIAYVLAIATSGKAKEINLVGFDGYGADDPRTQEMIDLLHHYQHSYNSLPLCSFTPTRYDIPTKSIYGV